MVDFDKAHQSLVSTLEHEGIVDERVLQAMREVPRHAFVPRALEGSAYDDEPLPIGEEQTISQPYIVALMAQAAELTGDERVLEVGTGSGYGAAVLSRLCASVDTVERLPNLLERARGVLTELHYDNVYTHLADGSLGWPARAPYDAIVVTAAADQLPETLVRQLASGGRLVAPVGPPGRQQLVRVRNQGSQYHVEPLCSVAFVPLISDGTGTAHS